MTGDLTYPLEGQKLHLLATLNMYVWRENFSWYFIAPVICFIPYVKCNSSFQCPMFDSWHNITTGMKLEVINFECDLASNAFWIATVIKIAGENKEFLLKSF